MIKNLSLAALFTAGWWCSAATPQEIQANVDKANKLYNDKNWKEAFDLYKPAFTDPNAPQTLVAPRLYEAINCLSNLQRISEFDEFVESVAASHPQHWRVLQAISEQYAQQSGSGGFIIAGKFRRGQHRGGGEWANSYAHDRSRAFQLMEQARPLVDQDPGDKAEKGTFFWEYANMFYRGGGEAWRFQVLTDFKVLPDYETGGPGGFYGGYYGRPQSLAPVDEAGKPVFYGIPKSFEAAANDGERWRWCLMQAVELNPGRASDALMVRADFLYSQFGEQTLADYGWFFNREAKDDTKTDAAIWKLDTLKDNEVIAKLASGIQRFEVPDDQNFLKMYQELAAGGDHSAHLHLCQIYENRRMYQRAADEWKKLIAKYGDGKYGDGGNNHPYEKRLQQIVDNWARFEAVPNQCPGKPVFDVVYRNGSELKFKATKIDREQLLADMMVYLKSNPKNLDWEKTNLDGIGWSLVQGKQTKYLVGAPVKWEQAVKPAVGHFDRRITVTAPVKSGAWWIEMKMDDGNTSYAVLWVNDLALVKKQLCNQKNAETEGQPDTPGAGPELFYVADSVTGKPAANAKVSFFGWSQEWNENGRRHTVRTHEYQSTTNAHGLCIPSRGSLKDNYQYWIAAKTEDGKFACLNIGGFWYREAAFNNYDYQYNQVKSYGITDRPVYRPDQKVQFKAWVGYSRYDAEDKSSPLAGKSLLVTIADPMGQEVFKKNLTLDLYGGLNGDFLLPGDAKLGMYNINVTNNNDIGFGFAFRVEEYKKPEFEVSIEAPKDPVKLGDQVEALVKAKYYFGAPVTKAKLKIKVTRQEKSASWYPVCRWDWLYENGYGWLGIDRVWYPGWASWGWCAPVCDWMPWWRPQPPPEVVQETTAQIGEDGTAKVLINTAAAKAIFGDKDQEYAISAEVTDDSRRTINGSGNVIVAAQPFKVYTWLDRGHYRPGEAIHASFQARRADGKPVPGQGTATLYAVAYGKDGEPVETKVDAWKVDVNEEGTAELRLDASKAGQYRLSCLVTDAKDQKIEGAILFEVRGTGDTRRGFRFNQLELVADKKDYQPGEKIKLAVNCDAENSVVLLFVRAADGICLMPRVLFLNGQTTQLEIEVLKKDMPNIFIEAATVRNGEVYSQVREICVPPESKALDVVLKPSATKVKPGSRAQVQMKITDAAGQPVAGSVVVAVYDKSVEYIAGPGALPPDIREVFWKWRRHHNVFSQHNLAMDSGTLTRPKDIGMGNIGIFGGVLPGLEGTNTTLSINGVGYQRSRSMMGGMGGGGMMAEGMMVADHAMPTASGVPMPMMAKALAAPAAPAEAGAARMDMDNSGMGGMGAPGGEAAPQVTVRQNFADTAFWAAALTAGPDGTVTVDVPMPENLTCWKVRAWSMTPGVRVGEGSTEIVTSKDLLLRLQAPRFFTEGDEVVLSANIHNYLPEAQKIQAVLELDGGALEILGDKGQAITVKAGGEERVDWKVRAVKEGEAVVRMKAVAKADADAMQMTLPVVVHGMLKTESWSLAVRPGEASGKVAFKIPADRRPDQSRLEARWSPTLAGAMLDALPYMIEYPYGCTEQTLNKFLPAAITRKVLQSTGVDLKAIETQISNLNAQEIGNDRERMKQWGDKYGYYFQNGRKNPVFDAKELDRIVRTGVEKLEQMQCSDGGWGWFSGHGEYSSPHTTAWVLRGLQVAKECDVAVKPETFVRGMEWLKRYQEGEVARLKLPPMADHHKSQADALDALAYHVLSKELKNSAEMREFLYRDRGPLPVYAKALYALALDIEGQKEKRDMVVRNIEQFLAVDPENQTAYLKFETEGCWWCWYGSEYEAQAAYLKLLSRIDPKSDKASGLVKYLLNNRKHATYWDSTRDTALCIEAFGDYLRATGEAEPNLVVEAWLDGQKMKEVRITKENLFCFDNKLVQAGSAVKAGDHVLELRKQGAGPLYANVYSTNFTTEKFITKAGLEVKVNRDYYKLVPEEKKIDVAGSRGQAVKQKVEKYKRVPLKSGDALKSGDLIEVEMTVDSKNDYEYLVIEDPKPAGCEAVEVRSGYDGNGLGAYVEYRDQKACFFCRTLARGQHSVSYRLRAEVPGTFSALPTTIQGMYAPELRGNSDEMKLGIQD